MFNIADFDKSPTGAQVLILRRLAGDENRRKACVRSFQQRTPFVQGARCKDLLERFIEFRPPPLVVLRAKKGRWSFAEFEQLAT